MSLTLYFQLQIVKYYCFRSVSLLYVLQFIFFQRQLDNKRKSFSSMKVINIKQPRIMIDSLSPITKSIFMKIQLGEQVYYFNKCVWIGYGRWQIQDDITIPIIKQSTSLNISIMQGTPTLSKFLGDSKISIQVLQESMKKLKQISMPIKIDGLIAGWLFFQPFYDGEEQKNRNTKFFYIREISIQLLKQFESQTKLSMLYEKEVVLTRRLLDKEKNLHFQIKMAMPVKPSGVIQCKIETYSNKQIANAHILLNSIERGTDSTILLIFKHMTKKIGQVKIAYFFQNAFLPNNASKYSKSIHKQKLSILYPPVEKPKNFRIHKRMSSSNSITKASDSLSRKTIERVSEPSTNKTIQNREKKYFKLSNKQNIFISMNTTPKKVKRVSHHFQQDYQQLLKIL